MSQAQFTLSWDSFQQNICNGLGALQQNEDFVDMTLAAEGHFVKVHQLVLSLASPYIKDLIKSAQCQNPVIFLNKISSRTLCSILEYIYTGQVNVAKENIEELIEAAKALHIKGLMDMSYQVSLSDTSWPTGGTNNLRNTSGRKKNPTMKYSHNDPFNEPIDGGDNSWYEPTDDVPDTHENQPTKEIKKEMQTVALIQNKSNAMKSYPETPQIQYSLSNQGSLQMILNRYLYYLRYSGKSGHRLWRCTDYVKKKCPASVTTQDDVVLRRTSAHIHPYHDKKIARKVRLNAIFSVITEAQKQSDSLKESKKE